MFLFLPYSVDIMDYIDWLLNVQPNVPFWDKPNFVTV